MGATTTGLCFDCGEEALPRSQRCDPCRTQRRQQVRSEYFARHPDARKHWSETKRKNNDLQVMYGLTLEQYEAMALAQGGLCGICRRPETRRRNDKVLCLAVDHDHDTGRVRGLLCHRCNTAIGLLYDDADLVSSAVLWLGET